MILDIHVHLLDEPGLDGEFAAFARERRMRFAVSCLGLRGKMLADPTLDQCRLCNDGVAALCRKHPDLAVGFCYANPLHGRQAVGEIRRCVASHGMAGVKLWIACRCSDERVIPIAEEAAGLGIPILQHAFLRTHDNLPGESTPADVAALAERCPEASIIMAHMGFRWKGGVEAVRDFANVCVDTSGFDPETGSIEHAVRTLGAERVLFGSDAPGRDILCQIGKVLAAEITEDDRDRILHMNAERVLGEGAAMIIDFNAHYGCWPGAMPDTSPEGLALMLAGAGVDAAVVSDLGAGSADARGDPDPRFVRFASVFPQTDLGRPAADDSIRGVRLYPAYHDWDAAAWQALLARAERAGCIVQVYLRLIDPRALRQNTGSAELIATLDSLSREHGRVRFVVTGAILKEIEANADLFGRDNVWIETSHIQHPINSLSKLIATVGADRVLFGTNAPVFYPYALLYRAEHSAISAADRQRLVEGNARRLLHPR